MKPSTALAVPVLLAVLGLAACDNANKQQANQPSDTGQQTGAVPSSKSSGTTGSSSTTTSPGSTTTAPPSPGASPSPPGSGTPPGEQTR